MPGILWAERLVPRAIAGATAALAIALFGAGCGKTPLAPPPASRALSIRPFDDVVAAAEEALQISRPVLVGSRNLELGSCVEFIRSGQLADAVPDAKADLDGGPGTKLAVLLVFDRRGTRSAADDLRWHQTRLAGWLRNQRALGGVAGAAAGRFAAAARALAARLDAAPTLPTDVAVGGAREETTWPGFCIARLDGAIRDGDLARARRWARELAGAADWLEDLHRWLDFLAADFLSALEFQALLPEAFAACDAAGGKPYDPLVNPSHLPAGLLTLHGLDNFMEVERQAEQLFTMPAERRAELDGDRHLTPASLGLPPERRAAFLALEAALGPANRATLAKAAQAPFERSFLLNALYRAEAAGTLPACAEVLARADRAMPGATVSQLMGVLVYRGHSFASLEWADRFQARLLADAAALEGDTPEAVWLAACRRAREAFDGRTAYGATLTLRDALDRGVFDCVRATDLALTLYRNAGRSGAGHVRWTAATAGHTIAALFAGTADGRPRVADPLGAEIVAERWPDACFRGVRWPEFLASNPQPWAAELYVRGLDGYVWAEGYAIRGLAAGRLARQRIPYLREFSTAGSEQVFRGPHPAD